MAGDRLHWECPLVTSGLRFDSNRESIWREVNSMEKMTAGDSSAQRGSSFCALLASCELCSRVNIPRPHPSWVWMIFWPALLPFSTNHGLVILRITHVASSLSWIILRIVSCDYQGYSQAWFLLCFSTPYCTYVHHGRKTGLSTVNEGSDLNWLRSPPRWSINLLLGGAH